MAACMHGVLVQLFEGYSTTGELHELPDMQLTPELIQRYNVVLTHFDALKVSYGLVK